MELPQKFVRIELPSEGISERSQVIKPHNGKIALVKEKTTHDYVAGRIDVGKYKTVFYLQREKDKNPGMIPYETIEDLLVEQT